MTSKKEKNNTEISARIAKILADAGVSPNNFASRLEYTRAQTIYDVLNGKSAPSYDFFKRFALSEYSVIYDIDWLLTGRGSMLRDKQPSVTIEPTVIYKSDPKDAKIIALQEEKIKILEEKLSMHSMGLGSAPAADIPSVGGSQVSPK